MNINNNNNNFFKLKSTNNSIGLKKHSLISNKLKNVFKNSNIVSSDNTVDKLNPSKQASLLISNKAADAESIKLDNMVEKASFSSLVGNFVNSALDETKTEIEDSMKSYSSYISKINDGTLDKNISFDDYADSEIKNKYQSNSIDTLVNQTSTSIKPVENTKGIDTLKEQSLELERTTKANSLYVNKIDHSPLAKNVSSNYYVNFESKKEYESNSLNIINTSVNKTDVSNNAQETKPIENTESISTRKDQAFEQLQNRIKKIIDNSINSLNNIFKGISVSSPELADSINEIKQNVTSLISSIKDINLDNTKNESEFANSLKKVFQNINKTQNTIRTFLYKQFKDIPGLDKDYLSKITCKFGSETANNLKRSEYDNDLIDSTFSSGFNK
jgi:hypothetical protein